MSSLIPVALPPAFPMIGLGIASTFILNVYQQILVSKARKESGVGYPTLYASEADAKADPKKLKYNCTQRGHQNMLENLPHALALLAFFGVFHPKLATAFITTWSVGRAIYGSNYASGVPSTRNAGFARLHYIGLLGLFFGSVWVGASKTYAYYF